MANKTNLTIRVEPKLKGQVKTLFKKLGMDVSTATNVFYRQALRCHGFPFPVTLDVPGEDTQQDIHEDMDEDSFLYVEENPKLSARTAEDFAAESIPESSEAKDLNNESSSEA